MSWIPFDGGLRADQVTLVAAVMLMAALPARAGDPAPYLARAGLDLATEAALIWAPDAQLVYVENDEDVADDGGAARWGYLFNSAREGRARGYTIREDRILEAAELDFDFEAPPLPDTWVDSDVALAAAADAAGGDYCREHGGHLATMLLIRGAFHDRDPDASTWTVVYVSPGEPALTVVVDARDGRVVRTWKG
jgi:hypothetical protein